MVWNHICIGQKCHNCTEKSPDNSMLNEWDCVTWKSLKKTTSYTEIKETAEPTINNRCQGQHNRDHLHCLGITSLGQLDYRESFSPVDKFMLDTGFQEEPKQGLIFNTLIVWVSFVKHVHVNDIDEIQKHLRTNSEKVSSKFLYKVGNEV